MANVHTWLFAPKACSWPTLTKSAYRAHAHIGQKSSLSEFPAYSSRMKVTGLRQTYGPKNGCWHTVIYMILGQAFARTFKRRAVTLSEQAIFRFSTASGCV
eukprot:60432-Pelagomonas_calceolata.AAC.2